MSRPLRPPAPRRLLGAVLSLSCALVPLAEQSRGQAPVYVDAAATGAADGSSWSDAFVDLQDALAAVRERPGPDEVWVAAGTYRPTRGTDRRVAFVLPPSVAVYGGFAGTESRRDDRDWDAYPTILSGEIGDPSVVADNALHVVVVTADSGAVTATTVLDGFTITGGYANGPAPEEGVGGGIYVSAASPTLRHLVVADNEAASPTGSGGGLYVGFATPGPTLDSVLFLRNAAWYRGGGLHAVFAAPHLVACRFTSNEAGTGGGATLVESSATLADVAFVENRAVSGNGGGLYVEAGNVVGSTAEFRRNRSAESGGGAYVTSRGHHPFVLVNTAFYGNRAHAFGGGLAIAGPDVSVANALFVGNRAARGGGVDAGRSAPTLGGVTATANEAPSGAGLFMSGGTAANAVFWGNLGPEVEGYGSPDPPPGVRYAIVGGGFPAGEGVADEDPRFVRPPSPGADGAWGTDDDLDGDLRPASEGPAIDAGTNAALLTDRVDLDGDGDRTEPLPLDLSGSPRVQGGTVDLGPYEAPMATASDPAPDSSAPALLLGGPNPFRDRVALVLHVPRETNVDVAVYDALGRRVVTLLQGRLRPGAHPVTLDGSTLSPGIYAVRASSLQTSAIRWVTRIPG